MDSASPTYQEVPPSSQHLLSWMGSIDNTFPSRIHLIIIVMQKFLRLPLLLYLRITNLDFGQVRSFTLHLVYVHRTTKLCQFLSFIFDIYVAWNWRLITEVSLKQQCFDLSLTNWLRESEILPTNWSKQYYYFMKWKEDTKNKKIYKTFEIMHLIWKFYETVSGHTDFIFSCILYFSN